MSESDLLTIQLTPEEARYTCWMPRCLSAGERSKALAARARAHAKMMRALKERSLLNQARGL